MRPGDHAEDFFPISSHLLLALWLLRSAHQQPQIYSGRSFRYPENTAQQRARRYRPNAAGWTPLGWSEKNRKVAISGVLPRSGLGWLSSRDRGVLPTFFPTSLFGGLFFPNTPRKFSHVKTRIQDRMEDPWSSEAVPW